MQTAEYNYQDFNQSQQQKLDENLLVKFFYKSREDKKATQSEGRPMFKEVEYVEIRVAGSRDAQACRPATFADKSRFPRHYEAFQKRVEMPEHGTPLGEWPQISRSQIEELAFLNCKTVEQLCEMSDTNAGQIRGGQTLKAKAKDWLESAEKSKLISEKMEMKDQIAELTATVAQMQENQKPSLVAVSVAKTVAKKSKAKSKKA
jgi:hypothetical protein